MLPPHKDPGRFNPALRNRESVLDPTRIQALIKEQTPEIEAPRLLAGVVKTLRKHVCALGAALDDSNLAAARQAAASLAALAANTGARRLEHDGRLIQASLNAGRPERAKRLWQRLDCDITALAKALETSLSAPEHDRTAVDPRSRHQ